MNEAIRQKLAAALRNGGLMEVADGLRGALKRNAARSAEREWRQANPGHVAVFPPYRIAYDAYGAWNPPVYLRQGSEEAALIARKIAEFRPKPATVMDWGCGPMRVLRHMSGLLPQGTRLIGLDYNPTTIGWCRANFPNIRFHVNGLEPPLPAPDGSVDVIYAISVFTHLNEARHHQFAADLKRCLAPGGLLIITLQGDNFIGKLTPAERRTYDAGQLVVRGRVTEGKRSFAAFHSPAFVRSRLLRDFEILEHIDREVVFETIQDHWIARNPCG